jgi:6-phosphogluconolactonase
MQIRDWSENRLSGKRGKMATYLYVAVSGEEKISIFILDPETGQLTLQRDVAVSGAVGPLTVDPESRFLYAGIRSTCEMASLRIDQRTGDLMLMGTVPLDADPCFIATDRRGNFLLSSYYGAGAVAVHPILPDGAVGARPSQWLQTAANAHSIQTDPNNRFAFVPHIAGPNLILQFEFDEQTGTLKPNAVPQVVPEDRAGPRHFCFHPGLPVVYFVNEQGSSVTAYCFDSGTGTLEAFQTVSTLPADYAGENTCAQMHVTPTGEFLYASNRGHDSIAGFAITPVTGELRSIGQQPTEEMPRAFGLDPGGRFLFVGGLVSGKLASYRVNGQTGALEPLETIAVGQRPMWVLVLGLEGEGGNIANR